jgi:NuA3 HAT complex component NTO1
MRHALDSDSESEFEDAPNFNKQSRRHSGTRKTAVTTKTARAHAKAYRPGPPIVPRIVVNSLLEYVAKVAMRKKQPFVERLCRYWSLKREARRGAPLLKRLHLEVGQVYKFWYGANLLAMDGFIDFERSE